MHDLHHDRAVAQHRERVEQPLDRVVALHERLQIGIRPRGGRSCSRPSARCRRRSSREQVDHAGDQRRALAEANANGCSRRSRAAAAIALLSGAVAARARAAARSPRAPGARLRGPARAPPRPRAPRPAARARAKSSDSSSRCTSMPLARASSPPLAAAPGARRCAPRACPAPVPGSSGSRSARAG